MKIVYSDDLYIEYSSEGAASNARLDSILNSIDYSQKHNFIAPKKADYFEIINTHDKAYVDKLYASNYDLYQIASLSTGAALEASRIGFSGEPAFALTKPPGHHAYKNQSWGYCYFSNMAISIKKMHDEGKIKSAFILDFDAHTGDGTIDCLKEIKEVKILNPMSDAAHYIQTIEDYIKTLDYCDIIGVSAGFDSYIKDCGGKLSTYDFYYIGKLIKTLSEKFGHNRRFAVLEGGYYIPDLGTNVLSFLNGFE